MGLYFRTPASCTYVVPDSKPELQHRLLGDHEIPAHTAVYRHGYFILLLEVLLPQWGSGAPGGLTASSLQLARIKALDDTVFGNQLEGVE